MLWNTVSTKKTGDKISVLGFGSGSIAEGDEKEAVSTIRRAYEGGVNYFDLAAAKTSAFSLFDKALGDVRNQVFYQIHFGATYTADYGWTTKVDAVKKSVEFQLKTLQTDHIDYGFIHCLDELSDWRDYQKGGVLRFLMDMKDHGVVRHIGLSSHTPATIQKVLDEVPVDMLMFSVNPAYDYRQGEYANGSVDERSAIYRRCEAEGIGISVMKPFAGGQLLDAATSPFGQVLSYYQCLQYALDRPGVLTVLPGVSNMAQLENLLGFFDVSEQERDYSVIGTFKPSDAAGKCVYCNHCKPCPVGLDVGLINKFYDLARIGDAMAAQHYHGLELHADACISCGHCNDRCPFGVNQVSRMAEINRYFQ